MIPINFKPLGSGQLPSGWVKGKWIKSLGGAHLATGKVPSGRDVVELEFILSSNVAPDENMALWGVWSFYEAGAYVLLIGQRTNLSIEMSSDWRAVPVDGTGAITVVIDGQHRVAIVNGKQSMIAEYNADKDRNPNEAFLFNRNGSRGAPFDGQMISFRWGRSGTLIADYQPVYNPTTDESAMFDRVSGAIFKNAHSSGRFVSNLTK